jgi:hypothetical protein
VRLCLKNSFDLKSIEKRNLKYEHSFKDFWHNIKLCKAAIGVPVRKKKKDTGTE